MGSHRETWPISNQHVLAIQNLGLRIVNRFLMTKGSFLLACYARDCDFVGRWLILMRQMRLCGWRALLFALNPTHICQCYINCKPKFTFSAHVYIWDNALYLYTNTNDWCIDFPKPFQPNCILLILGLRLSHKCVCWNHPN